MKQNTNPQMEKDTVTKNDQIAAEAESTLPLGDTPLDKKVRIEQIKSAIKKATAELREQLRLADAAAQARNHIESRAAHASEQDAEAQLLSKINKAIRDRDADAFLAAIEESSAAHASEPSYSICSKHLNREDGCPECWPPHASEPLGQGDQVTSDDSELSRCQKACQEQAHIIAGLHQKLAAKPDFPSLPPHGSEPLNALERIAKMLPDEAAHIAIKTLQSRAAHASESLNLLQCPYCKVKVIDPEALTMCCTPAIKKAIEAHKIKAEDTPS